MRKINILLLAAALVVLSSCGTSRLEKYPNFLKQKNNISKVVALTDYSFEKKELTENKPYSISETKILSEAINFKLEMLLNSKGYKLSELYTVAPEYPYWINPIRAKSDTINKVTAKRKRSTRRRGSGNKVKYPAEILKHYVYLGGLEEDDENYRAVLPVKIDTNKKILNVADTLVKENISAAVLLYVRGVTVSAGKQIAEGLTTGLISGLASAAMGGGVVSVSYSISWTELQLLIVDRENNDILWSDIRFMENVDPLNDFDDISEGLVDMFEELPNKWEK